MDGYRAVRYGGDYLPQRLGAHIARGEHAGEARAGGFVGDDIAGSVQLQLISEQLRCRCAAYADEYAVAGKLPFLAGLNISQPKPGQAIRVQQR